VANAQLNATTEQYRQEIISRKQEEAGIAKFNEKLDKQLRQVHRVLDEYAPGTPVRLVTPTSKNIFYGVVAGIDQKQRSGSPAAPNRWKIRILVADSARQIIVPLSKFNSGREGAVIANVQEQDWFGNDVYSLFDKQQAAGRINRQIFTGNLIKAFEKYPNGKLINYTDDQGNVRQGLMMPKGFDIQEELTKEPVAFSEPYQVKAFITDLTDRKGAVKTLDELLILKAQRNGEGFMLQAPAAKESGGKYFLDEAIITTVGSDFHSVSDSRAERLRQRMEVVIPPEQLEQTLHVLMNQRNDTLAAFDLKEIAREYLGIKLPTLEVIEPESLAASNQLLTRQPALEPPEIPQPIELPTRYSSNSSALLQQGFAEAARAPQAGRDAERDTDGDGLTDAVERSLGTSVDDVDTDGDGLSDRQEVQSHLDPLQADTDGDGRNDQIELVYGSDPHVPQGQEPRSLHPIEPPSLKALADQVRETDLETVAASLGLEPDRHDKHKWRNAACIINISQGKFMDWLADKGGGGAIDLVMHMQGVNFKDAVQWLSGRWRSRSVTEGNSLSSGESHVLAFNLPRQSTRETVSEPRELEMPVRDQRRWAAVRDYLVETRKLPVALVDRMHERGLVYADLMQNAVFVRYAVERQGSGWQRGEATGATLRGTWGEGNSFHGLAPGSDRESGWFWIGAGSGEISRVLLTESPIDALSLATLDRSRRQTQGVTIYLSTDGAGAVPVSALQSVLERGGQVVVAFDADAAGEEMAWRVAQQLPGVSRMTPAYGKDWNERLVYDGQPEQARQPERDRQMLKALWRWHQVAKALDKSGKYLSRITEVAREVNRGEPLSERAKVAMQQDLQMAQEQQGQGDGNLTAVSVEKPRPAMESGR
jgi:hypothetical protein